MARERLPASTRKRQIAEAALRILARRGARSLTAHRIAQELGVTDAALFRHFDSMERLVDAAIATFEQILFEEFPPEHPDPMERLERFFVRRLELVSRQPHIMQLALNDRLAEAAGAEGERAVQDAVARSMTFVRDCLAEAQSAGTIVAGVAPDVLAWMVTGAIRGAAMARVEGRVSARAASPKRVWREVERVLRGPGG